MRVGIIVLVLAATAGRAAANPYEAFIDVDSEDDLYDLQASGQISDDTFNVLIDLIERGVDLNTASREELYSLPNLTYDDVDAILDYRKEQKFIRDPADLVGAGALSPEKLLAISAFLIVRDPFAGLSNVHGFVQAETRFTTGPGGGDDLAPPVGLRARVSSGHLTAGAAASETRLRIGDVTYDPQRDALITHGEGVQVHLPKAYVQWDTEQFSAIAGSYRIGFGQRLTFDDSSDYTPNGIYHDDQLFRAETLTRDCNESTGELAASPCTGDYHYLTPDFKWRETLTGVAAGAKHIPVGVGWLQLYGWGSFQPRSIYQYELYRSDRCTDPRDSGDAACDAPPVLVVGDDRLASSPALAYSTLPNMVGEAIVGGNATYFASRRTHLGLTAYGAHESWLTDGIGLDYQEWSSRPAGGSFGAVGLDAAAGIGSWDVGVEATNSFDQMIDGIGVERGGGGPAVVVRTTWTVPKKHELELTARYLDTQFLNPFARPISEADQFEGQTARDEEGLRARYTAKIENISLRTSLDVWRAPSDGQPQVASFVRADVKTTKTFGWGAWAEYNDKDLREGGHDQCYDQEFEVDQQTGAPINCKGRRFKGTGRVSWRAMRDLTLSAQATDALQDDRLNHPDGFRQDVTAWLAATYKVSDLVRLRGRIRFLDQDVTDNTKLERSLWTYGEVAVKVRKKDTLRVRADLYQWLDQRTTTLERTPSPEVRFWAQYEAKF